MFTTRNIFIAFGIVTALLVALYAYNLYQEAQIDARTLELQEMHGDKLSSGSSIKHIRNDSTGVYLEIDGKEVCIPLPEGYEILKEEDYPIHYTRIYKPNGWKYTFPLCGFINSDDIKNKDIRESLCNERMIIVVISKSFFSERFSLQDFELKKGEIKKICQNIGRTCSTLYENEKSVAFIDTRYDDILYIKANILIENVVISVEFQRYSSEETDKQQSIDDAIQYIMLLNKQF